MSSQEYLEKMKKIQNMLIEFIEIDDKNEENYQNLIKLFDDYKIQKNRFDLKSFLNVLINISNNHYRTPNFFSKIEKILSFFSDEIKKFFSNSEIFNLFKSNKRILLYLIEEKMLSFNKQIAKIMTSKEYADANYPEYFEPEIKEFIKIEPENNIQASITMLQPNIMMQQPNMMMPTLYNSVMNAPMFPTNNYYGMPNQFNPYMIQPMNVFSGRVPQVNPMINSQVNPMMNSQVNPMMNPQINQRMLPMNPGIQQFQMNQRMNQFSNQQMNQLPNQQMNQLPNQQMNQLLNQQMNQLSNQQMNQIPNQQMNQFSNQQMNQLPNQQMNQLPNQQLNPQVDGKNEEQHDQEKSKETMNKESNTQSNEDNDQPKKEEKNREQTIKEDIFNKKREIGENDDPICEIIRKDDIEEFIIFVNKNNYPLKSLIKPSIFETNIFLIKEQSSSNIYFKYYLDKHPTLIEYSAFFGSVQIFKYLYKNNVEFTSSLWLYAIHGQNPELISILEDKGIMPKDNSYKKCFKESLKCHHNEIANYINDNYLQNEINSDNTIEKSLKYYNFAFIPDNSKRYSLINLCKYDYYNLVYFLLKTSNIDINHRVICHINF